jgi:hypothetical protein
MGDTGGVVSVLEEKDRRIRELEEEVTRLREREKQLINQIQKNSSC